MIVAIKSFLIASLSLVLMFDGSTNEKGILTNYERVVTHLLLYFVLYSLYLYMKNNQYSKALHKWRHALNRKMGKTVNYDDLDVL